MLIITMGLPGSGKSFFAKKLANKLDAVYFNSDGIRKEMHAEGKYSLEDKLIIYDEMEKRAEKQLKDQKTVILDATFYLKRMRNQMLKLAEKAGVTILFMLIEAEESIIKKRLSEPREESEADFEVYELIRDKSEEVIVPHLRLQSTHDNISEMLEKALIYIQAKDEKSRN